MGEGVGQSRPSRLLPLTGARQLANSLRGDAEALESAAGEVDINQTDLNRRKVERESLLRRVVNEVGVDW